MSEILKDMIVDVSSSGAIGTFTPEETTLAGVNAAVICKCFCRVEFAKERRVAGSDESELNEAVLFPVVDAMVALLRRDVGKALVAPGVAPAMTTASPPPSAAVLSSAVDQLLSGKCVEITTSLGRMVQVSEKCKARVNEQGVLPVLLDCFKVPQADDLHQVADKLLHLCILLPGNDDVRSLNVNPRILSVADEVADFDAAGRLDETELAQTPPPDKRELPFLSVESVLAFLDLPPVSGDNRLLFRAVRWLAVMVACPKNARVLGESSIEPFVRLALETSPQNALLFGFLSKIISAIVSESSSACEVRRLGFALQF